MRTAALLALGALLAPARGGAEPARPSPPFTILRAGKPPLRLSRYRGKVVALAFIQTTCPHCQQLTLALKDIGREFAPRGVQVLACAFNDDAQQDLPEFLERFQPAFPVGWNNRVAVMSFLQITILDPRPLYVPHMVFLDRAGVIRSEHEARSEFFRDAGASIRAELKKLLNDAVAAPARGGKG